jgi:hypothetical protein
MLLLERARDIGLRVTFKLDFPLCATVSNGAIAVAPRFKTMVLRGKGEYVGEFLERLNSKCSTGILDHLGTESTAEPWKGPSNIFEGGTPQLRKLELQGLNSIAPLSSLLRRGCLTTLKIGKILRRPTWTEIFELLQTVEATLKLLELDQALPKDESSHRGSHGILRLSRLEVLKLSDLPALTYQFLRRVLIPRSAHVALFLGAWNAEVSLETLFASLSVARSSNMSFKGLCVTDVMTHGLVIHGWVEEQTHDMRNTRALFAAVTPYQNIQAYWHLFEEDTELFSFTTFKEHFYIPNVSLSNLQCLRIRAQAGGSGSITQTRIFWHAVSLLPHLVDMAVSAAAGIPLLHCLRDDSVNIKAMKSTAILRSLQPDDDPSGSKQPTFDHRFPALKRLSFDATPIVLTSSLTLKPDLASVAQLLKEIDLLEQNLKLRHALGEGLEGLVFVNCRPAPESLEALRQCVTRVAVR